MQIIQALDLLDEATALINDLEEELADLHLAAVASSPGETNSVASTIEEDSGSYGGTPSAKWRPSNDEVHAWRDRNDMDMFSLDECRTAIEDDRSAHVLAAAPATAKGE